MFAVKDLSNLPTLFPPPAKVVIGGSATFFKEINKAKLYLEDLGYKVLASTQASPKDLEQEYPIVHKIFMSALFNADIYLVINLQKHGIAGYIGPAVFAEILYVITNNLVFGKKTKVVLLNKPALKCGIDEIKLWQELGWVGALNSE